jgi:hypothetical protein
MALEATWRISRPRRARADVDQFVLSAVAPIWCPVCPVETRETNDMSRGRLLTVSYQYDIKLIGDRVAGTSTP